MAIPIAFYLFVATQTCLAQEFRIYTKVFDELATKRNGKTAVVSRSLTIFHAGKVYDQLVNEGEVVIFEPSRRRFTLLNTHRNLATTVHLDDVTRKLKEAYRLAEKSVEIELRQRSKRARHAGRMLEFQLRPDFREAYNSRKQTLTLSRPSFTYRATGYRLNSDRLAQSYREYADWISRLNYVLDPTKVLPEPRLQLNQSLFQKNLIPVVVSLEADIGFKVKLRAEHQIHWSLDQNDRNSISNWESELKKSSLRFVSWKNYQREVIMAKKN